MNTCPNCGKIAGLHSSILQGCMCQYSTKALPQREWQGLKDEEIGAMENEYLFGGKEFDDEIGYWAVYRAIEAKLKEKNAPNL